MSRDRLFLDPEQNGAFRFDHKVAEVFDDMLDRSIPCYRQVMELTALILGKFLRPGDTVYDLGCSTGTAILTLAQRLESMELQFVGIDNSAAMIAKAILKASMYTGNEKMQFREEEISRSEFHQAGGVILNYTLQFIPPSFRAGLLQRIFKQLRPGGILILSEKTTSDNQLLNQHFIELYHDFKRSRGYSDIEITRKKEALEHVLTPFSSLQNQTMLQEAGFSSVSPFFQWFNFVSYVAVKDQ